MNTFERVTWGIAEPNILNVIELKSELFDAVGVLKIKSNQMEKVVKEMVDVFLIILRPDTDAKGDLSHFLEWEVTDDAIEPGAD